MNDAQIVPVSQTAPVMQRSEVGGMILAAIDKGLGVEALQGLYDIYRQERQRAAESEYFAAFSKFKAACGPVKRNQRANIVSRKTGAKFGYSFASLDEIDRHIGEPLSLNGLSYQWDSEVADGRLICTCTLRHCGGHSISARFSIPIETDAGMSEQQKVAAALTFARRQSLTQVLGLSTTDDDVDGADVDDAGETLDVNQIMLLDKALRETNSDLTKFLTWTNVTTLDAIPKSRFDEIMAMIEGKRAKA